MAPERIVFIEEHAVVCIAKFGKGPGEF